MKTTEQPQAIDIDDLLPPKKKSAELLTKNLQPSELKLNLGFDFADLVTNKICASLQDYINENKEEIIEEKIKKFLVEEVKKLRPTLVKINTVEPKLIEGLLHSNFEEALYLVIQERQLFISGPAGSGKTTLSSQIAEAIQVPFSHISCSAGTSEAHLLGRMLFDGTYVESDLVRTYENGGVFLFDEIDAADSNTLLVINSALANGKMSVPNRKEKTTAIRHKDFYCIVAGNTWGNGSLEYHGRNYLDAAFLDRFAVSKIYIDYDKALEGKICDGDNELAGKLWALRDKINKNNLKRILSTRVFVSAVRQKQTKRTWDNIFKTITLGWSKEEILKVC